MRLPTFNNERRYWRQGVTLIAGIDEVGMGALAGPVVAAAVVFDSSKFPINTQFSIVIRDSKMMSAKQREKADIWIKDNALAWAISEASVAEITKLNIRVASHLAMRRAVEALKVRPDLLLIDGMPVPSLRQGFGGPGSSDNEKLIKVDFIIDGDELSMSIAAASILAKVHRDDIMQKLDRQFPGYKLASNKGYGSAAHKAALMKFGVTPHHRPLFAPIARLLTTG